MRLRTDPRPDELGAVVRSHGFLYPKESGFDVAFEACVAAPVSAFAAAKRRRGVMLATRSRA